MAICAVCQLNFTPRRGEEPRYKFADGSEGWRCFECDYRERQDQRERFNDRINRPPRARVENLTIPLPPPPPPGRFEPLREPAPKVPGKAKIEMLGKKPGPPPKTRFDLLAEGGLDVEDDVHLDAGSDVGKP